jgi:hypothetical protein
MNEVYKYIELKICERYSKKYQTPYFLSVGYFKDFDFVDIDKLRKIELKFDIISTRTGNFAIEISYRGYPSGISSTKANYFVLSMPGRENYVRCFEVETETLKNIIKKYPVVTGGDGKRSMMKLLPVEVIPHISTDIFDIQIIPYKLYW